MPTCSICGKTVNTVWGLNIHTSRLHKTKTQKDVEQKQRKQEIQSKPRKYKYGKPISEMSPQEHEAHIRSHKNSSSFEDELKRVKLEGFGQKKRKRFALTKKATSKLIPNGETEDVVVDTYTVDQYLYKFGLSVSKEQLRDTALFFKFAGDITLFGQTPTTIKKVVTQRYKEGNEFSVMFWYMNYLSQKDVAAAKTIKLEYATTKVCGDYRDEVISLLVDRAKKYDVWRENKT